MTPGIEPATALIGIAVPATQKRILLTALTPFQQFGFDKELSCAPERKGAMQTVFVTITVKPKQEMASSNPVKLTFLLASF